MTYMLHGVYTRVFDQLSLTDHIASDLDDAEALPHHANNRARDDVVNLHMHAWRGEERSCIRLQAWHHKKFLIQGFGLLGLDDSI